MTAYRMLAALIGWGALALQYWLMMNADVGPEPIHRTINFFSYFTILINILVALAMTFPVLAPNSGIGRFFDRPSMRTVVTTFIIIVGVTNHYLLSGLRELTGLDLVADTILHYVMPVIVALDWLFFVPKGNVPWSTAFKALPFPLLYMVWTYFHGEWTGFYPYPFVDVSKLGIEQVLINAAGMTAAFFGVCLILIVIGKLLSFVFEPRSAAA